MNTATIEKCIELLNTGKIDDLRDLLNYERETNILASKGVKMSLLNAVKKIVCDNGLKEWRKNLYIQHTPDGKQFICDGYLLVKWNEEQPELNALPQTPVNESINANNILRTTASMSKYELTESDKIIAENIDKYIKLYNEKKARKFPVKYCNKFFDATYLKRAFSVIGTDFEHILTGKDGNSPLQIYETNYSAVLLPININTIKDEDKTIIEQNTQKFVEQIKGA
jgi:hypothetical protein